MSFFNAHNLCRACGGELIQPPHGCCEVIGVGTDTRDDLSNRLFIALRGDQFDGHDFLHTAVEKGATLSLVDRDVSIPIGIGAIRVDCTRAALGRLAATYRDHLTDTTVIAITGTVGKTTTKQLIGEVLATSLRGICASKSFNNDIGVPLTVLSASPGDDYLVVEIGMNAPGEIAQLTAIARPDIAVITHVGAGHLEGVGTVNDVAREKFTLLDGLPAAGLAVVNVDSDAARHHVAALNHRRVLTYGATDGADLRLAGRSADGRAQIIETNDGFQSPIGLPGRHNAINALAALAVGRAMGVADDRVASALSQAQTVSMRLQVDSIVGVQIINDAYNANPESMTAALDTLLELAGESRCVAVLGDMLELGDKAEDYHRFVMAYLMNADRHHRIEQIVLVGPIFGRVAAELGPRWDQRDVHWFEESGNEASHRLDSIRKEGDVILLKGSRGMRLEGLLDRLRGIHASTLASSIEMKPDQAAHTARVGDA